MATDLTGLKVKDTYNSLLKIGDNSSLSATPDKISDGLGNESVLYLSTSQVSIGALPATGYDLTVGNSGIKTQIIDVVGAATAASLQLTGGSGSQGTLSWNTDEETVDIIQNGAVLQLGQETHVHVKNQTGSTINDGTPVYVTGTLGASGRLTVAPMIADGTIEAKYFLGITTEDIPNGEDGKVTTFGKIRGLDTTAYSEGQTLFVSASTAGEFQITAPVSPNLDLEVAIVINVSANNGTIFVRATNGQYLGLLHDVYLNGVSDKDLLVYDNANSRWSNSKTIGDLSAGNLTLSGYLRGAANFVIDPAAYGDETGVVQILGDLRVDGTTTTINSTTVTIDDKNLVLASGSATAADANGAGITIDGADATMTYESTADRFVFNKNLEVENSNPTLALYYSGEVNNANSGRIHFVEAPTSTTHFEIQYDGATNTLKFNSPIDGTTDLFTINRSGNATASGTITATTFIGDLTGSASLNVLKSGDTMTGNLDFNDDVQARFGTGDDLKLYHNGLHSFIDNATNALYIRNVGTDAGDDIIFVANDTNDSVRGYIRINTTDGAVQISHHDGLRLATTDTGIDVTGDVTANAYYGDGSNLTGVLTSLNFSGIDGITLRDEDSTIDSYFHAKVDYDAGLYQVISNARYGADYIQVDGSDTRSNTVFAFSPKDSTTTNPDLFIGGDNSVTAPNTLTDWRNIKMNASSVRINGNEVATRTWVSSNTTLQDVTDNGNITTNSIIFEGVAGSGGEVAIRANGEAFEIYEPEQSNKVWLSIADDPEGNGIAAQLNSPTGFTPILTNYNKGDYITKAYIDGLNVDADTLDGLDSTQFLRSDADDYTTGKLGIKTSTPTAALEVLGTDFTITQDYYKHAYVQNVGRGLAVVGNESTIDVVGQDTGNHSASLMLRGWNAGFGFINDATENYLTLRYFEANADNFSIHGNGVGVQALTEIAQFKTDGDVNFINDVTANHYFADTHFRSIDTAATLSTTGAGTVYLRPNGYNQPSGQVTISSSGETIITGSLGVGMTTSPTSKFHVIDAINRSMTAGGEGQVEVEGAGYTFGIALDATAAHLYHNSSSRDLVLGTNELPRVTIKGGGNVGIGTDSASNTLHIYKNATIGNITSTNTANAGLRIQDSGANMYMDGNSIVIAGSGYLTTTGDNVFNLGTNEQARITILGTGEVGINETNPNRELNVNGQFAIDGASGMLFSADSDSNKIYSRTANNVGTAHPFDIRMGSALSLYIDTNSNIGIGNDSPSHRLHAYHPSTNVIGTFESGDTFAYINIKDNASDTYGCLLGVSGNDFLISTGVAVGGGLNTRLYIDSSNGNMGLGTDSPSYGRLVLSSNQANASDYNWLVFDNQGGGYGDWNIHKSGNNNLAIAYGTTAGQSYSDAVTFEYGGNVGFKNTNPSADVHIGNGTASVILALNGPNSSSRSSSIAFGDSTSGTAPYYNGMSIYYASSENRLYIKDEFGANGNIFTVDRDEARVGINQSAPAYALDVTGTIRATSDIIAFSDARVKENVKTIDNALDKVTKLRGVEYNKIGEDEQKIGVIAQEIEQILPQVVQEDEEGMKSVAYGNIVGVLIEAIKEQQKHIDELKAKLDGSTN